MNSVQSTLPLPSVSICLASLEISSSENGVYLEPLRLLRSSAAVTWPSPLTSSFWKAWRKCLIFSSGRWWATTVLAARSRSVCSAIRVKSFKIVFVSIRGASVMLFFLPPPCFCLLACASFSEAKNSPLAKDIHQPEKSLLAVGLASATTFRQDLTKCLGNCEAFFHLSPGMLTVWLCSLNSGHTPQMRNNAIAPTAQISHGLPLTASHSPSPASCSGAWHSIFVRSFILRVHSTFPDLPNLPTCPKSISFRHSSQRGGLV
mmetsp:Transcript_5821/g.10727  ORF Transcript_5821/g.10727 Transcript_5821/m.10727 type:complete len:261 (-) Transcript_5821:579-1361(-)